MAPFFRFNQTDSTSGARSTLRSSGQFRFCTGKCQSEKPPEGGVETSPGKWRCGACWIEMARKRQSH
jgi:hypothetical protein